MSKWQSRTGTLLLCHLPLCYLPFPPSPFCISFRTALKSPPATPDSRERQADREPGRVLPGGFAGQNKESILMSDIPDTVLGKIEFFEQHIPVWAADPVSIGLDLAAIAEISTRTGAARIAYNESQAARSASRARTVIQTDTIEGMMEFGTAVISTIKAFADISGDDQSVYAAAELSPDDPRAPLAPPVPATDLNADLLNTGAIKLTWKGTVSHGTFYAVWRRLDSETAYKTLGSVSAKAFTDTSLPVGTPEANYYLVTHRDELSSDATEPITVRFGSINQTGTNETSGESGLNIAA